MDILIPTTHMDIAQYIAQVVGLSYFFLGLGIMKNPLYYQKAFAEMLESKTVLFFGSIFALVVGFIIVRAHNVWMFDWRVVITILGWISLGKGIILLLAPTSLVHYTKPILVRTNIIGPGAAIVGALLLYAGFFA